MELFGGGSKVETAFGTALISAIRTGFAVLALIPLLIASGAGHARI